MADDGTRATATTRARTIDAGDGAATKEELQGRMEEARESIAQTVTDIRDRVVGGYESVKGAVADTLDWREQFRAHPVAWVLGALAVGYVLGNSFAAALRGSKDEDALLSHLAAIGDRFSEELTKHGMSILAPALTGTILVPVLASKVSDLFGVDLSDLTGLLANPAGARAPKKKRKKGGVGKNGKKAKKKKGARSDG